jgi:hypothetical protein
MYYLVPFLFNKMYNKNTKNTNVKYIISILLFELVLLEYYTYIASRYAYRGWNTMIQLHLSLNIT